MDIENPDLHFRSLTTASLATASEEFRQNLNVASQQVEAERSVVVSDYEDREDRESVARALENHNDCLAVTYYVRRVDEVYELCSKVTGVLWQIVQAPLYL